ncbi:MAG: hypothetical protein ABJZ55_05195 [Fuerstiella sp.]
MQSEARRSRFTRIFSFGTLTVEAAKSSTRIELGKHTVEINGPSDGYELRDNAVVVMRGDVKRIQVFEPGVLAFERRSEIECSLSRERESAQVSCLNCVV